MDHDEIARQARAAGLARYLDAQPDQITAALRAAADLARRLPRDFKPAEEPVHTLKLKQAEGR